jgi:amidophosphoribosyltransferase
MCAIFGAVAVRKAAELTVIGLHANQHRAVDYAGVVTSDGIYFYKETGDGLVRRVFTKTKLDRLHGKDALGHLRYPTVADDPLRDNKQPITGIYGRRPIAIAHNGNLTNVPRLRELTAGLKMSTSMDTEYILRLLEARHTGNLEDDLVSVLSLLEGSFALGILLPNLLIAVRDRFGNRPLSIGNLDGGYCISSETCAFPNVGAELIGDVEPGTMVFIDRSGMRIKRFAGPCEKKCRFEGIYYGHPASRIFGEEVGRFRMKIGRALESAFPVPEADIVIPVPDSAIFIGMGFAESGRSGTYFPAITRNHYVGRTFIAATQAKRDTEVAQKFTFAASEIKGKNIVVVDDSIERGTTMPKIVGQLRQLGAKAIHLRIGSPPIPHSCTYGINTPTTEELIASSLSPSEMCRQFGADSLEFLPLDTLKQLSPNPGSFCFACMDGNYW